MEVLEYREGSRKNRMNFELKDKEYTAEYQSRSGPTAGIRIENNNEAIYTGSVDSLYSPSNQEELMDHVEEALGDMLSSEIAEELLENPENVQGEPGDEIVYISDNELDIAKR